MDKEKLEFIRETTHPESRLQDLGIASDRLSYLHIKNRGNGGSFVEPTNPKKYEAGSFAREVINDLEAGRVANLFQDIILVAPSSVILWSSFPINILTYNFYLK